MPIAAMTNRSRICRENFNPIDQQFTHIAGEGYDGFHKTCLARWVAQNPTCPYDKQPIDPNSLISLTDRVMERLGPVLVNSAYAALFGAVITGAVVTGTAVGVIEGAAAIARVGGTAETKVAAVEAIRGIEAAGAATGVGAAVAAIAGEPTAVAVTAIAVTAIAARAAIARPALVFAGVAGIVGAGIDWILNRRGVDQIALQIIGNGMYVGGLATAVVLGANGKLTPLTAIPATALVTGFVAGGYSLIKG